jgi:hypothetical protein
MPIVDRLVRIELNNDWRDVLENAVVLVRGIGDLYGSVIQELRIEPESQVGANGLTVIHAIVMRGNSVLRSVKAQVTVRVIMEVENGKIPLIIVAYNSPIYPVSFEVRLGVIELGNLPRVLVNGSTFMNCEDWRCVGSVSGTASVGKKLYCRKATMGGLEL